MHKLIMMSRTYQLACDDEPTNSAVDYDNDYLWRFNRRRLEAMKPRDRRHGVGMAKRVGLAFVGNGVVLLD